MSRVRTLCTGVQLPMSLQAASICTIVFSRHLLQKLIVPVDDVRAHWGHYNVGLPFSITLAFNLTLTSMASTLPRYSSTTVCTVAWCQFLLVFCGPKLHNFIFLWWNAGSGCPQHSAWQPDVLEEGTVSKTDVLCYQLPCNPCFGKLPIQNKLINGINWHPGVDHLPCRAAAFVGFQDFSFS